MGAFQQLFGNTLGGFFASEMVQLSIKLVFGYVVILWLASAYWAFRDMRSRTDNLALPYMAGGLVILFSPLFFWLGLLVYRIVRPSDRVADRRERELSEAVLLSEVGEIEQCAGCRRTVEPDWIVCPSCRTELRERCRQCDRLVEFDWLTCAWCGTDLGRMPAPRRELQRKTGSVERRPVPGMDPAAARSPEWPSAPKPAPKVALAAGPDQQVAQGE